MVSCIPHPCELLQGNTDESELTDVGRAQAVLARQALQHVEFVR
jgi:broad specificity phosphatase PhoE